MLYRHFQVMKSIWGGGPNVEPIDLGYDSILEDFDSLIKECCHFFLFHRWIVNLIMHASGKLQQIELSPS